MSNLYSTEWDLYIGFPVDIDEEIKQSVINVINERHPDGRLEDVLDGYWSGVEEVTYHIKVNGALEFTQTTVKLVQVFLDNGFVALCEAETP